MKRAPLIPTLALVSLLLAACAATPSPGIAAARVIADIHAGAERLRSSSYRVTFDMLLTERAVRWHGTMRTLGGVDAIWSADGVASDGGVILDTISVVDAGGVRYLDSKTKTFRGYEWVALDGDDRTTYYWRSGWPAPLPDADPHVWCDLSSTRMTVSARTADGGTRYRLIGWTPGPRLAALLDRAELAWSPNATLDLTLTEHGMPARLDVELPGASISLVVDGTATRERIKVPKAGQFTSMPELF